MNKIIILARTYAQAERFAWVNGLHKMDFNYAYGSDMIRGQSNCVVIYLEGCQYNRDYRRIHERVEELRQRGRVEVLRMKDNDKLGRKIVEYLQEHATSQVIHDLIVLATKRHRETESKEKQ